MLRLRTLSGSELSFISGMIVASQVLAWVLILTFMSQVSPVKLLGKQMAGLTEVGSICCYTHCPCYLLHFLLPVDMCCFAWSFHSFNVIYLSLGLSKPEYLSATLNAFALLATLSSRKAHDMAGFCESFRDFA